MNLEVIQNLTNYAETLRSIMWIDSLSSNENSRIFIKDIFDESPDPFVLIAWLCKHLEEFVLYGYKYLDDNLIAISRLRSDTLKRLEVVESDIIYKKMRSTNGFWVSYFSRFLSLTISYIELNRHGYVIFFNEYYH